MGICRKQFKKETFTFIVIIIYYNHIKYYIFPIVSVTVYIKHLIFSSQYYIIFVKIYLSIPFLSINNLFLQFIVMIKDIKKGNYS